jgi:hypothetical protein
MLNVYFRVDSRHLQEIQALKTGWAGTRQKSTFSLIMLGEASHR